MKYVVMQKLLKLLLNMNTESRGVAFMVTISINCPLLPLPSPSLSAQVIGRAEEV